MFEKIVNCDFAIDHATNVFHFLQHLSALQSLQKPQDGNIFFKRGDVSRKSSHASILSEKSLTNTSKATPSTSLASNGGAAAGKEQFGRSAVKRFASRIYKKLNKASARSGLQESKKSAKKDDSQREGKYFIVGVHKIAWFNISNP